MHTRPGEPGTVSAVREVTDRYGPACCPYGSYFRGDLVMTRAAQEREPAELAPDGVHPSRLGHRLIADAWLTAVGSTAPDLLS
ncbi:hypothetical protein ACFV6Z_28975 [Streptomyces sp. NPDC059818]|uniref:hypothetical protein n=1 Tax=Streptomyces sp. NPDC059818 TaxID=3346962 RepID=UPI00364B9EE7